MRIDRPIELSNDYVTYEVDRRDGRPRQALPLRPRRAQRFGGLTVIRAIDSQRKQSPREMMLSEMDRNHLFEFEQMLNLIRDRVRSVAERYQVGSYIAGRPASSKTYTAIKTLEGLGVPWAYRNSRMSPLGLYAFLEEHPEHTCVIDDIPALLDQRQSLQIIMAALGGQPGKPRPVTYTTKNKHDRKSFEFSGGIIAISNLPLRRDPLADAVASRIAVLEHEPSDEMIAAFMRREASKGYKDIAPAECLEVVEFVIAETRASDYRLDLRHMTKALEDYRFHMDGKALRPWQELVRSSMKRIFKNHGAAPTSRAERVEREKQIVLDLFRRFPNGRDKSLRDAQWHTLTEKAPDSLYRRKRELEGEGLL